MSVQRADRWCQDQRIQGRADGRRSPDGGRGLRGPRVRVHHGGGKFQAVQRGRVQGAPVRAHHQPRGARGRLWDGSERWQVLAAEELVGHDVGRPWLHVHVT